MDQEKLENIIEKTLLAHRSAVWWQAEMMTCMRRVEELDKQDPYGVSTTEERVDLEQKAECLIRKGEWEDSNLDRIMSETEYLTDGDKRHIVSEITNFFPND